MAETQPMMLQELCYTAADFRLQLASMVCDEGVSDLAGGSLLVTTGGAGLDLSVAEGAAFINSDSPDQGVYSVYNDAPVTVTATAADATNPRIDQVIATVNDSQLSGTDDDWVLSVLAGTPTGGATLSNLTGAAALPDRSIRLAYVLVPATFAGPFVDATHILDARQPFASCTTEPYVSLEAAATTNIPNSAVLTKVALATTVHLDASHYTVAASVVTVTATGLYDIHGSAGIGFGGAAVTLGVQVTKNGVAVRVVEEVGQFAGLIGTLSPTRPLVPLTAGDTLQLTVFQNSASGAQNTIHDAATGRVSRLTIRKVG